MCAGRHRKSAEGHEARGPHSNSCAFNTVRLTSLIWWRSTLSSRRRFGMVALWSSYVLGWQPAVSLCDSWYMQKCTWRERGVLEAEREGRLVLEREWFQKLQEVVIKPLSEFHVAVQDKFSAWVHVSRIEYSAKASLGSRFSQTFQVSLPSNLFLFYSLCLFFFSDCYW